LRFDPISRWEALRIGSFAIAELELEHGGVALAAIDAALEVAPDHPTLLAHRALILARLKRVDRAQLRRLRQPGRPLRRGRRVPRVARSQVVAGLAAAGY
jgi:acyl-coenzyme A thioesterase PaaI-like protein